MSRADLIDMLKTAAGIIAATAIFFAMFGGL